MSFLERFGIGDKQPKKPAVPYVDIDPTIDGYRYAHWDPYILLDDIRSTSLDANSAGDHLWVSNEQLQMTAATTWLAAVRQSIGNTLVSTNEDNGRIPADVAEVALTNYQSAQQWLLQRDTIREQEGFKLDNPNFKMELDWPVPHLNNLVSPQLLSTAHDLANELFVVSLPTVIASTDTSLFLPAEYKGYEKQLTNKLKDLEVRFQHLNSVWSDHLDPNMQPGANIYRDTVLLIEDVIEFGVHSLVPVTGNSFYKLKPIAKRPENDKNAFAPQSLIVQLKTMRETTEPGFSATSIREHAEPPRRNIPAADDSRAFSPSGLWEQIRSPEPVPPPKTEAEPFDPAKDLGQILGTTALNKANAEPEPFDPKKYRPQPLDPDDNSPKPFDPKDYRP